MNSKAIKVLGWVGHAVGIAATLLSGWVSELKMNETIEKKVNEAFVKHMN